MAHVKITELGCPGHFCSAARCHWRRHTQIGKVYRVSTVGNYYPNPDGKRETLGSGRDDYFETMVFETSDQPADESNEDCGCVGVADWCEIEGHRYKTAGEAQRGHAAMVRKYTASARTGKRS